MELEKRSKMSAVAGASPMRRWVAAIAAHYFTSRVKGLTLSTTTLDRSSIHSLMASI